MAQLPKPFSRPSISLGGADDAPRTWKTVSVSEIHAGDLIPDFGTVQEKEVFRTFDPKGFLIVVKSISGNTQRYSWHYMDSVPEIFAFTR